MTKAAHHRGNYHVASRKVREAANRDSSTRCWRCGGTARPGDPWQAGHVRTGDPTSPLLPEHRSCNASHGAAWGNRRRKRPGGGTSNLNTSRPW